MIFYFSGTGNTRWAAEQLATLTGERLFFIPQELGIDDGETTHESEAAEAATTDKLVYRLDDGERIGFCFPVHGWQPPRLVRQFVSRLQIVASAGHYCYAVVTCGDSIGCTMELLQEDLSAVGLTLDSVFSLTMPESYVCLPFMYTDKPEREQEKINTSTKQLEQFTDLILQRKSNEVHTVKGIAPWVMSHVIGAYFNTRMISDKKFTVDADSCIHCGKCQQACPTGDLLFDGSLPTWQHNDSCTCCLACYHHCPRHAINYGSITRQRGQYYFGHRK
jgi:NAD-dependent dihydropyrimidine dehydrogenase PreA subunit